MSIRSVRCASLWLPPVRWLEFLAAGLVGLLLAAVASGGQGSGRPADLGPSEIEPMNMHFSADSQNATATELLREGTRLVRVQGRFVTSENRPRFESLDGAYRLQVLENQMLERVTRAIEESLPGEKSPTWVVDGKVTEYRGVNFFLLTRSVLKSTSNSAPLGPGRLPPRGGKPAPTR